MSEPKRPEADTSVSGDAGRVEAFLRVYLRDSSLWPVLLAAIATFGSFGSGALWLAFGERNPFAMAALAILALLSLDLWAREVRDGRFGLAARGLASFWALCLLGALGIAHVLNG